MRPTTGPASPRPRTDRWDRNSIEQRLHFLVEMSTDWYWELDPQGRFTTILHRDPAIQKDAQARLLGKSRWEVEGEPVAGGWTDHKAAIASRQPFCNLLVQRPGPGNTVRYLESSGRPRYAETGEFIGYAGITRDVTGRMEEQQLLTLDRELTRLFTESDEDDVPRTALNLVCRQLGWSLARYWLINANEHKLQLTLLISIDDTTAMPGAIDSRDREVSERLVSMAQEFGDILWSSEIACDRRSAAAAQFGDAVLVPVSVKGATIGVIEFRRAQSAAPGDYLKDFLRRLGAHLAGFRERTAAIRQLQESEAKYSSTVELAAIGISHVDLDGRFLHANRQLQTMLGYSEQELLQMTIRDVSHPDDRHFTDTMVEKITLRELDSFTAEKRYITKSGKTLWVRINAVMKWDDSGNPTHHISTVENITERKEAEQRVAYLATHDELTDLPNRVYFNEQLARAIKSHERRQGSGLAVLFLDLDRFKIINDSLGHEAGDCLLRETADRIRSCIGGRDCVARFGGDEFVILLESIDGAHTAEQLARQIIDTLNQPMTLDGQKCRITTSIGIAIYPQHGRAAGVLTRNADVAMYAAKQNGKNCAQLFSADLEPMSVERLALERRLQDALELDEFRIQYQPRVHASTGEILGVEALLRWWNHELGTITPAQFIPVAEDTGLIIPIGKWVLSEACKQHVAWVRAGLPPIIMSVNLSPRQFSDANLIDDIQQILDQTGMSPECLELEITESMLASNVERSVEIAGTLRAMGIGLAIDDFGTGYSSFVQLKRFPISSLKIDRSFTRDLQNSGEDKAIMEAIIAMGKTLGVRVVAEGVETTDQQKFLVGKDCDEIQGFLFGRPCHPNAIADLLRPKSRLSA